MLSTVMTTKHGEGTRDYLVTSGVTLGHEGLSEEVMSKLSQPWVDQGEEYSRKISFSFE